VAEHNDGRAKHWSRNVFGVAERKEVAMPNGKYHGRSRHSQTTTEQHKLCFTKVG